MVTKNYSPQEVTRSYKANYRAKCPGYTLVEFGIHFLYDNEGSILQRIQMNTRKGRYYYETKVSNRIDCPVH